MASEASATLSVALPASKSSADATSANNPATLPALLLILYVPKVGDYRDIVGTSRIIIWCKNMLTEINILKRSIILILFCCFILSVLCAEVYIIRQLAINYIHIPKAIIGKILKILPLAIRLLCNFIICDSMHNIVILVVMVCLSVALPARKT